MNNEKYWCQRCTSIAKIENLKVVCEDEQCKFSILLESYRNNKFEVNNEVINNNNNNNNNNSIGLTDASENKIKQTKSRKITPPSKYSQSLNSPNMTGNKRGRGPNYSLEESTIISKAYAYYGGDVDKVIRDSEVKALNRTEGSIKRHIASLKYSKNQIISPSFSSSSLRSSIINDLDEIIDSQESNSPNEGSLGDIRLDYIDIGDRDLLSDNVTSEDYSDKEKREKINERMSEKAEARRRAIQLKSQEKKEVINSLREQQRDSKSSSDFKESMMMMMWKQMQDESAERRADALERRAFLSNMQQQSNLITMLLCKHLGLTSEKKNE